MSPPCCHQHDLGRCNKLTQSLPRVDQRASTLACCFRPPYFMFSAKRGKMREKASWPSNACLLGRGLGRTCVCNSKQQGNSDNRYYILHTYTIIYIYIHVCVDVSIFINTEWRVWGLRCFCLKRRVYIHGMLQIPAWREAIPHGPSTRRRRQCMVLAAAGAHYTAQSFCLYTAWAACVG